MLVSLSLYSLTFPPFLNTWFSHTLCFHISLLLSLSLSGIANSSGSHFSGEWVSPLSWAVFSYFFFNPNLLPHSSTVPQSRCTAQGENTGDAFPCATRDVHNPIPLKQMSYINLSLRKPRFEREREGDEERGGKEEEQRNDQGGSMSDPTCFNASTHTNTHCRINGEDVVTTPLCNLTTTCISSSFYPLTVHTTTPPHHHHPCFPPTNSRLSAVNNKESNLRWIYSLFHWETSHCAFAFGLKGTIKVVRWAHYDLSVLSWSHQSQCREGVGWLCG